jgi:hypothetical protein
MAIDLEAVEKAYRERYFRYIKTCAELLGITDPEKQGALIEDRSWFFCFDDRLTPEQAVAEYRATHSEAAPKG